MVNGTNKLISRLLDGIGEDTLNCGVVTAGRVYGRE